MRYAALALAMLPSAAFAQDLISAAAPDAIVAQFQAAGLQAKLDKDGTGDPMIVSSAGGAKFTLIFYDCKEGKDCGSLQFNACFDLKTDTSFESVNDWNGKMRYGKASLDDKMDPCLNMDVETRGGITAQTFDELTSNWQQILGKFTTHIGF